MSVSFVGAIPTVSGRLHAPEACALPGCATPREKTNQRKEPISLVGAIPTLSGRLHAPDPGKPGTRLPLRGAFGTLRPVKAELKVTFR